MIVDFHYYKFVDGKKTSIIDGCSFHREVSHLSIQKGDLVEISQGEKHPISEGDKAQVIGVYTGEISGVMKGEVHLLALTP